ncbi:MAG: tetratricopeptide repeat protein [Planctomycetota bacterium]|nr:tetratricopeptide repeat protein [Planctomycetota bacterium]
MMHPSIHRSLHSVALILLVLTYPAAAKDADDDGAALRAYYSANGLLNRGLFDLAAAEYREFLTTYAEHEKAPIARYGLGVSLFRLQRYDNAAEMLQSALREPELPYRAEAALVLAQSRLAQGRYGDAAAALDPVLREHAGHELADDAAALRAEALYYDERYEQVRGPCHLLASRWPDSPHRERTELLWSMSEMALGEYGAAAERLRALSQRFPDGALADQTSLLLAQSLHRSNAVQAAIEQYRRVIRRAHDAYLPDALYGLATLLHKGDQPSAAGELLDRLIAQWADHELVPAAHLLRGRTWFDLADYERAHHSFTEAARTGDAFDDSAGYWAAKCDLRRDRPREAADALRQTIGDHPDSDLAPEMMYDLAVALSRAGDPEGVLETLRGFRSRFADHPLAPGVAYLRAVTLHEIERYADSLEVCRSFQRDFEHTDHDAPVASLAGENEFLLAAYERAAETFRAFLDEFAQSPQRTHAAFRLGVSLYRLRRYEEAEPILAPLVPAARNEAALRTVFLALGDLHFQRDQWGSAEAFLEEYLSYGLDQPSADDGLLKLGLARHRQDRFDEALEAYDELLEHFPESAHRLQALFERGQALVSLGSPHEAADAFEQVLQAEENTAFAVHALNHLGAIAVQQRAYDDAARFYARVVNRADRTEIAGEALFRRASALMSAERFDLAAQTFASLLEEHPDSPHRAQARAHRIIALTRLERHPEALALIDEFEKTELTQVEPSLAAAVIYEKAWSLRTLDRPDEAMAAYRELARNTADPQLYCHGLLELAELEADGDRYEEATRLLRRLLDAKPPSPQPDPDVRGQALYRLGVCEYNLEHFELAADLLGEFIDASNDSPLLPSAYLLCGESLVRTGAHQRAAVRLRRVVDDHSDSDAFAPALLRLGECLAVLQHWARSEEVFALHRQRFPHSDLWFKAQFGLAWARENQDRHRQAIETYREIVAGHDGPTAARAQFQIGECLFAQGMPEEAVRELLKVDILYAYPEWSAAALYEAGRCFEELNKPAEARAQFQQVQEHYSDSSWAKLASERLARLSAASSLPGH